MLDMKSFKDWARDTKGGKSSEEEKTAKFHEEPKLEQGPPSQPVEPERFPESSM